MKSEVMNEYESTQMLSQMRIPYRDNLGFKCICQVSAMWSAWEDGNEVHEKSTVQSVAHIEPNS